MRLKKKDKKFGAAQKVVRAGPICFWGDQLDFKLVHHMENIETNLFTSSFFFQF